MAERGKFIVLEGQGFSGKTEQAPLLVVQLQRHGLTVIQTQEPGGVPEAEKIREQILTLRGEKKIGPEDELRMFYESRGLFLGKLVVPETEKGKWVVSTRFSASTYVYQGREGGISKDLINQLDREVVGSNQPDLYLLLDVAPEEIIRRLQAKDSREKHSFNEVDENKIKLRAQAYLDLAKENRYGNWEIVDGNGSIQEVRQRIWTAVANNFFKNGKI